MGNVVKRCSTSTVVEASDHQDKKPLQLAESELQSSETDVKKQNKLKRQQIDDDDSESMKNLQEIWLKAPLDTSSKKEEEAPKKTEELATFECCFESKDSEEYYTDSVSVYVTGFDTSLPRDDIKTALWKHFESFGCQVRKVFVPIECKTAVPLGFAFVYVDDDQKALELGSGSMGGCLLRVTMAKNHSERHFFPNFKGCRRCGPILLERRLKRFREGER